MKHVDEIAKSLVSQECRVHWAREHAVCFSVANGAAKFIVDGPSMKAFATTPMEVSDIESEIKKAREVFGNAQAYAVKLSRAEPFDIKPREYNCQPPKTYEPVLCAECGTKIRIGNMHFARAPVAGMMLLAFCSSRCAELEGYISDTPHDLLEVMRLHVVDDTNRIDRHAWASKVFAEKRWRNW